MIGSDGYTPCLIMAFMGASECQ